MITAHPTEQTVPRREKEKEDPGRGEYQVLKGPLVITGFGTFYEAYMHALNRFCSEDFLVTKSDW